MKAENSDNAGTEKPNKYYTCIYILAKAFVNDCKITLTAHVTKIGIHLLFPEIEFSGTYRNLQRRSCNYYEHCHKTR